MSGMHKKILASVCAIMIYKGSASYDGSRNLTTKTRSLFWAQRIGCKESEIRAGIIAAQILDSKTHGNIYDEIIKKMWEILKNRDAEACKRILKRLIKEEF